MISVLVGGDLCPIKRNEPLFRQGRVREIYNDILPEIESADLTIVNLECPLVDTGEPKTKTGPSLRASEECIRGIHGAGIDVVNLANNHIMDYGANGLQRTLDICRESGVATIGAGSNLEEAQRLFIRHVGDKRIAVMGIAEHEWSVAEDDSWGAAPQDIIQFFKVVRENADAYDFLIVLVHGGMEYYPYPTPKIQGLYRFLAENGANAIICQHTHCAGSFEVHRGVPLIYGQGDFIFDKYPDWPPAGTKGFLVSLSIDHNQQCDFKLIPCTQSHEKPGVHRLHEDDEEILIAEVEHRSRQIRDSRFVKQNWLDFCRERRPSCYRQIRAHRRLFHSVNLRMHLDKFIYRKDWEYHMLNRIRCETLREFLESVLESNIDG